MGCVVGFVGGGIVESFPAIGVGCERGAVGYDGTLSSPITRVVFSFFFLVSRWSSSLVIL